MIVSLGLEFKFDASGNKHRSFTKTSIPFFLVNHCEFLTCHDLSLVDNKYAIVIAEQRVLASRH